MKIELLRIGRASLIVAMAIGYALAQQAPPEKSAREVRLEQEMSPGGIAGSPLCQWVLANPQAPSRHDYPVDRSTLVPDLRGLMRESDEVLLTSILSDGVEAIAPSGDDVIGLIDVKVLRAWKGSHKPGDTVTFATPSFGRINCLPMPQGGHWPHFSTFVGAGYWTSDGFGRDEAYILFLRHAQGSEKLLTPGLRMTGGSGLQGMYSVQFPFPSPLIEESHCQNDISGKKYPDDPKLCTEFLDTSDVPIFVPLKIDPLFKRYNGMRVSEFLEEIQNTADSLADTPPIDAPR